MSESQLSQVPRVVVGVDGSERSLIALRWGAAIAASTGARLDAITAWNYQSGYGAAYLPMDLNPTADADKALTTAVDAVFGAHRPPSMRLSVQQGQPASVLSDESDGALMLIVGSRGHGGFIGLLLGSVSASVAEHAKCPVLVVHGDHEPPRFAS